MPRRDLTIRAVFAPTRSSSLQVQGAYEKVMPQVEYVAEPGREQEMSRERELRPQKRGRR